MAEETKKLPPKRPNAKKRDIQHAKKRLENRSFKSKVKTAIRSFEQSVSTKDEAAAKSQLNDVYALLDKGVNRGVFKLNKVSRLKHKFAGKI